MPAGRPPPPPSPPSALPASVQTPLSVQSAEPDLDRRVVRRTERAQYVEEGADDKDTAYPDQRRQTGQVSDDEDFELHFSRARRRIPVVNAEPKVSRFFRASMQLLTSRYSS